MFRRQQARRLRGTAGGTLTHIGTARSAGVFAAGPSDVVGTVRSGASLNLTVLWWISEGAEKAMVSDL